MYRMNKKYELTDECIEVSGHTLYRIRALRSFSNVKKGDLGGYVEKERNLSHDGDCWVYDDAKAFYNARVFGDAMVSGTAKVFGDARVYGSALIYDTTRVNGDAWVCEYARVYGDSWVSGNATVCGNARVVDAWVNGNAAVSDNAHVFGGVNIFDNVQISGSASVGNNTRVHGISKISGNCILKFDYRTWTKDITLDYGIWINSCIIDNKRYIISNTLEQLYIGDVE
jgi:carbonic anhydrase/acetyltransferase-like protein (isoleucine patch superfamily)